MLLSCVLKAAPLIFSLFFFSAMASADQCFEIFKKQIPAQTRVLQTQLTEKSVPNMWRELFAHNKLQELIWAAQTKRRFDVSVPLEKLLKTILETDSVISSRLLDQTANASTETYLVQFKSGVQGIFKPRPQDWRVVDQGHASSSNHQSEIAAFKLDVLLGLQIVPFTVEREINGQLGSLQVYLTESPSLLSYGWGGIFDLEKHPEITIFDFITGNLDRAARNMVVSNGQLVAIDNGRAFPPLPDSSSALKMFYYQADKSVQKYLRHEYAHIFQNIRLKLTKENLTAALGQNLTPELIDEIIIRKDKLLSDFDSRWN